MQDKKMIEWMLYHCVEPLEVASAGYNQSTGKVDFVRQRADDIGSFEEYEKRYRRMIRFVNRNYNSNIWIRPAVPAHKLVMLNDLPTATARAIVRKYRALAVETSRGNCQVWIVCSRDLTCEERQDVARSLCRLIGSGSDPGAISEPRWGRLAGYLQRKPGEHYGFMTRIVAASGDENPPLDPAPHLANSQRVSNTNTGRDRDESRREFVFACMDEKC